MQLIRATRIRRIACVLVALPVIAISATAQPASFSGKVLLDGKETPLRNAEIQFATLRNTARSDSSGAFRVNDIPPGNYRVTVRLIGYEPFVADINFGPGQKLEADMLLTPTVTKLKDVNVNAKSTPGPWAIRLAEFDERRATGIGRFLTADYFASKDGRPLSSFIQEKIPGIRIVSQNGRRFLASARGCGMTCPKTSGIPRQDLGLPLGHCYMQIIVNGTIRFNASEGQLPFDLDEIQSLDIVGLEFYTVATTPLQYRGSSQTAPCGTVVLWTKGG